MKSILLLGSSVAAGYIKVERAGVDWHGASQACQAKGMNLVTFDSEDEFRNVMQWLGDSKEGFWIGYRDDDGDVKTESGAPAGYTNFLEGEPNNKLGEEHCIRLRFGTMNDALCEIYWAGPKKQNIGMGYICEGAGGHELNGAPGKILGMEAEESSEGQRDADNAVTDYPTHIMSNVYRSNKKNDAKYSTGVFVATGELEHGRPIYVNHDTNVYLSFSYNEAEQMLSDAKWKFSSQHQVGSTLGGHVFLHSDAASPDAIPEESKCTWFKSFGSKKNRKFRQMNCIVDPQLFGFDGENAVGIEFAQAPKSKLALLNGVYVPVEVDGYDNAYQKLGDDMYAIYRNDQWEFTQPRGLHNGKSYAIVESQAPSLAEASGSAYVGKKSVYFATLTFE